MPIYEFACGACGQEFEDLVGPSDTPRCPKCDGTELAKRYSSFAVGAESHPSVGCEVPASACGDPGICGNPGAAAGCGMLGG